MVDAHDEEPEALPRDRSLIGKIAKVGAIILAVLAVIAGALVFGLDTAPGRRFVADRIAAYQLENGVSMRIGRIEGSIYGSMVLHDVTLVDPKGAFMTAPQVSMNWRPLALLSGRVEIPSVIARKATLQRLPDLRPVDPDDPWLPEYDITVDQFRIDSFIAQPAVSGQRRAGSLSGTLHIAEGRAQATLDASARAQGPDAGIDRIALMLDAVPDENRLALELDLEAPANGVITALAGLSEPLEMRLSGKGDWSAWRGQLEARYGGAELASLELGARSGTFSLRGPTRLAGMFEGQLAALLGDRQDLAMTAALDAGRVQLDGTFESEAVQLDAEGKVDLSDNRFEDVALTVDLAQPAVLAPDLCGKDLRALLTLNGEFGTPLVQFDVSAGTLAMGDIGLEELSASGMAEVSDDRIAIPLKAQVARITGLDTVAGGALRKVTLTGDLAIEGSRFLSDNIRIASDRLDVGAILLADLSSGRYNAAIDGKIDDYRVESVGTFALGADGEIEAQGGNMALTGRLRARSTTLANAAVSDFLGGNLVAASDVRVASDGTLRFSNLSMRAPLVTITSGGGSYAEGGRISLDLAAETQDYGPVGLQVAGTLSDPEATLTAERPGLGIGLANLRAGLTSAPGGYWLDAVADTDYGGLTADLVLGLGETVTLDITTAQLAGVEFSGTLEQTAAGPFAGRLNAKGRGVTGLLDLDGNGQFQEVRFNLRSRGTVLPDPANISIGSASIDGRVILYEQPLVLADAQISSASFGQLELGAARARIDYRKGEGTAKIQAEGRSTVPFRVAANVELKPDLWRAAVKGRVRGITFATASPARIVPGEEGYELLATKIDFGRGSIRVAGSYGDAIALQSRFEGVNIALVEAFVPGLGVNGQASGSFDFSQSKGAASPRADLRMQIAGLRRTTALSVSQPVAINFAGKLLPDRAEARAVIRQRGKVLGRLVAELGLASSNSEDWAARLWAARLTGGVRYQGSADTLYSFAGQPAQRVSGSIGVAADFSGRLEAPQLAGIVRGTGLVYEHTTYGTRLTDIAITGRFKGDRLDIERLTANAGEGTLSATGFVSLAEASGYPMNIEVLLDNARLARSEALSASATGNLQLIKTQGQTAMLSGRITLPETRYRIVRQGAAQVPELSGVRFKPRTGPQRITGDERAQSAPALFDSLRLDIALDAPERLYVSGMGLETEWRTNLRLTGTSAAPRLSGDVRLVRGTLGFAGRSFDLSEGRLTFAGGPVLDPVIAMNARETIEDVTVNVGISGRAYDPQIAFSSDPGLPQDEILSRILFGDSIADLSAVQAVQLAASLNALNSSGGGLNPLGKLRSATGIDRLRILGADEANGRGTALAAGQYLTDDIYLEFITDARGFTATQLEISLTPTLSILSQAGGSGATNINVRYRLDY